MPGDVELAVYHWHPNKIPRSKRYRKAGHEQGAVLILGQFSGAAP